ncbi:MAG: hypothetical protein ACREA8_08265 [Nitrosotalea sp.]
MEDSKTTSLQWGAGMGFIGIVIFILNPNTPILSLIQAFFGHQITLGFLQFMSALTVVCGLALLYHGFRSS